MSVTDVELVREMLEAFNRGDYDGSTAMLHEEIEMHQWGAVPDTDTYIGKEEFLRGLRKWLSGFEPGFQYVPEKLVDGGDCVVAHVLLRGTGRESGVELEQRVFQVYEVRDGKVFRVRVFSTEPEAREAAGLAAE